MSEFEVIERAGVSNEGISETVKSIIEEAHAEKPVAWFKIQELRGRVTTEGQIEFQVAVQIGRKL